MDDLVGMRLTCSAAITQSYTPDVFGSTHYVTESAYILENSAGGYMIVVESMFSAARFSTHNTEDTVLNAQCRIEYKPTVAKYTGMTVMFDQGKEFTMKQGAGALYQLTDGSGVPPSAHDIEGRAYTIYSQLEITATKGKKALLKFTIDCQQPADDTILTPADLEKYFKERELALYASAQLVFTVTMEDAPFVSERLREMRATAGDRERSLLQKPASELRPVDCVPRVEWLPYVEEALEPARSFLGSVECMAPEVLERRGHNHTLDI